MRCFTSIQITKCSALYSTNWFVVDNEVEIRGMCGIENGGGGDTLLG